MDLQIQTIGRNATTIHFRGRAMNGAILTAKVTPRVLGMISDKKRIERVKTAENQIR